MLRQLLNRSRRRDARELVQRRSGGVPDARRPDPMPRIRW